MPGTESPIQFRDAQGRLRFETGLLNGSVFEVVNSDVVAITTNLCCSLDRFLGTVTPYFPSAAESANPPKTVIYSALTEAAGFVTRNPFGVSVDFMPVGGVGRVASIGCIMAVNLSNVIDSNGAWIVAGNTPGATANKATQVVNETLGLATTAEKTIVGGISYVGVLVLPG